ncbi:MAG: ribonuclease III [Eubacterium sp.]|nr:ribonuclease III [Eubacterium sp.]
MLKSIEKCFEITEREPDQIGPLKLAYLGDAVYELIVRTILMDSRDRSVKKMNKAAQDLVNATTQARIAEAIEPKLDETEVAVFHRGRNAKNNSMSKHSDIHDYRIATGLESLFGYWYMSGKLDRAVTLLQSAAHELKLLS